MFNKNEKTPKLKTPNSRLQPSASHLTPDSNSQLSGLSPPIRFRSPGFEYTSQLQHPPQNNNIFYQNRPFNPPYNNPNAFHNSSTGLYRPTTELSTSSQPNQPYSPINPTNLDMNFEELIFSQDYNYSQDYSMGHGSGHGSAPGSAQGSIPFHDDKDDSLVEEVSPVKPRKPSRRVAKAKKDEPKEEADEDVGKRLNNSNNRVVTEQRPEKAVNSSRGELIHLLIVPTIYYETKQKMEKEGQGTTVLYRVEESGIEYPGGRGLRNMSNLSKLEFGALNVTEKNYMPCVLDAKMHIEYMGIAQNPSILWKDLNDRFDNQREVLLPAVQEEWRSLRFQDFKKVNEYSSALFRICSQLKFCGQSVTDADMLEKTYSTFHASNMTLQQQYRLQKFTRYSELNAYLLVAEQNNELLMKNHQSSSHLGSLSIILK
ncbi:hypothetical protein Tco_1301806 [Tanacetum coccineum]